ncbi:L-fucose mutarotase [Globicatella sanguinis]|uniref:L-fucose mutarotase n=1 Tax=Globicatella sanguinis TaxID=13076 RepID=UPI00254326E3|nr:L-fucose mutarotase [Globicatella sanguinis]MDK7631551.1 L-fucose mutarotase [Globicatella sanguinis]WIK66199.1 L-fucose mutarotase [Globicatella sanguinis]WKT55604.1 L-fucose mutarotase [Globicatella sanguinis]
MLKNISKLISPSLLKVLMEMGHGDEIVIADGNFPAASKAKILIDCDGLNASDLLAAILELFPLDTYVESPVMLMKIVAGDEGNKPQIWDTYQKLVNEYEKNDINISYLERQEFYERSEKAYAIVKTSEMALYGNLILKKGVIN